MHYFWCCNFLHVKVNQLLNTSFKFNLPFTPNHLSNMREGEFKVFKICNNKIGVKWSTIKRLLHALHKNFANTKKHLKLNRTRHY